MPPKCIKRHIDAKNRWPDSEGVSRSGEAERRARETLMFWLEPDVNIFGVLIKSRVAGKSVGRLSLGKLVEG
jgi:hypothetical protein